ncbi:MAG TPA: hypothetical protein G4O01_02935 [Dehalococcoidia bacterium]|nr:hypothetical protein [Dehalococcoidia bacterium]
MVAKKKRQFPLDGFQNRCSTLKSGRSYKNPAEAMLYNLLKAEGWEVTKAGYPDFICRRGDEVMLVEVKPDKNHRLKRRQSEAMKALAKQGVKCLRWSPDEGFRDINNISDDDDIYTSSSSSLAIPTTFNETPLEELARELTEEGFDGAMAFILKHDPARIRAALELARHKRGRIKNLPGYVRYLVQTPGEIPKVPDPGDKYLKGKYSDMIRR